MLPPTLPMSIIAAMSACLMCSLHRAPCSSGRASSWQLLVNGANHRSHHVGAHTSFNCASCLRQYFVCKTCQECLRWCKVCQHKSCCSITLCFSTYHLSHSTHCSCNRCMQSRDHAYTARKHDECTASCSRQSAKQSPLIDRRQQQMPHGWRKYECIAGC